MLISTILRCILWLKIMNIEPQTENHLLAITIYFNVDFTYP